MRLAVSLLIAASACGRLGFAPTGDAMDGAPDVSDAADGPGANGCTTSRLSSVGYGGRASLAVVTTPSEHVVFSTLQAESTLRIQRIGFDWQPIDTTPWMPPNVTAIVTAAYTDRLLLAFKDTGATTTTVAVVTFGGGVNLTGASGLPDPPGIGGLVSYGGGARMVTPSGVGYELWRLDANGANPTAATGGGAGTEAASDCASGAEGDFLAVACTKPTEPSCPTGVERLTDGAGGAAGGGPRCPQPTVLLHGGVAYLAYESATGIDTKTWQAATLNAGTTVGPQIAGGSVPYLTADASNILLAYSNGNTGQVQRFDPTTFTPVDVPQPLDGVPDAPLGFASVIDTHTNVIVASTSGLYRVCL